MVCVPCWLPVGKTHLRIQISQNRVIEAMQAFRMYSTSKKRIILQESTGKKGPARSLERAGNEVFTEEFKGNFHQCMVKAVSLADLQ